MTISLLLFIFFLFLIEPLLTYFWDAKKLRRFPNATLFSGISNLPYTLQRLRGFRSKEIHSIHEQHPILRLGPNTISFSTPSAIRTIYGHSTPCVKGGSYEATLSAHPGLIEVIDKEQHARKRRILSNAFTTRNLEQWEFKVADKAQRLVRQFDRICREGANSGSEFGIMDFRKWTNLFTIEAIIDIALSQRPGCLDRGDDGIKIFTAKGTEKHISFIHSLQAPRRATSVIAWSPWFHSLKFVLEKLPGFLRMQWQAGKGLTEIVQHLVRQRVQRYKDGEKIDDLTSCLLEDKTGQARNLSISEIEGDITTLLDAGSDTTAIALTHVMYFLLKTPVVLARLREEVDTNAIDGDESVIAYASVKNLLYLRACLDESLRLLPPVSTGLHRLTPPQGLTIDEHYIPGNTIVVVPIYTAHRNPMCFPDPEKYRPERWLCENSKEAQASFIPFSAGARGCIGRNITYMEQTILLATLIRRYDFTLLDPGWELSHEEAFNLWPGPMPLKIKRREFKRKVRVSNLIVQR